MNDPTQDAQLPSIGPGGLIPADQALPSNLFILPITGAIPFPTLMAPIHIEIPRYIATIEEAISRQRFIGLLMVREGDVRPDLKYSDLYSFGVVARILKRIKMPDGSVNLLIQSMKRFRVPRGLSNDPHILVEVEYVNDDVGKGDQFDALTRMVIANVKKLSETNPFFTEEMRIAMINAPNPGVVADLVAFALSMARTEAQEFLETLSVKERIEKLLLRLKREQNVADLQKKIQDDVNTKVSTMQREFFLREQMKVIKKELGLEVDSKEKTASTFREKIEAAGMNDEAKAAALQELAKFETLSEGSPEYNVSRSYLEMICALPWSKESTDQLDLDQAQVSMDRDHYGLEKVKERILEFLAVRKLLSEQGEKAPKGSILCLVGPPGVGKTSIGKSIANVLGRKCQRISLGGMRDEAEIKGHRRTYVGALPGKLIQAMKRAGTLNPVILLDEVDKIGASYQGDPASALLEVLDPEQNHTFNDHYLDLPFDLSKVLFVTTANSTQTIPGPLLDRMEVIEIPGYTVEEKEKIARSFLLPRVLKAAGLAHKHVKLGHGVLSKLISDYAREPGVRILQQLLERIARKVATKIVKATGKNHHHPPRVSILPEDLPKWVGSKRYINEIAERITEPGVVVGLAWTAAGGDILFVEASDLPVASTTQSGKLIMTGQLGEVMSESAAIAWSVARKKVCKDFGMKPSHFQDKEFHLHLPAGAIPKDGPSAGITMAAALVSLLTGRMAFQRVAMTGELSLTGKVLPVGGIKEKLLAAKRAGIKTVILPFGNRKDLDDLPKYVLKGIELKFLKHFDEVIATVLDAKRPNLLVKKKAPKRVLKAQRVSKRVSQSRLTSKFS